MLSTQPGWLCVPWKPCWQVAFLWLPWGEVLNQVRLKKGSEVQAPLWKHQNITMVCIKFQSHSVLATLPQATTVAVSVYWSFYFSLTPLTHPPHFCLAHSYLSRLQRSTREEHRRHGLCMKCLAAQLGGKTHVSSSSTLSSIVKCPSDTKDSLKIFAVRSWVLFWTTHRAAWSRIWHV